MKLKTAISEFDDLNNKHLDDVNWKALYSLSLQATSTLMGWIKWVYNINIFLVFIFYLANYSICNFILQGNNNLCIQYGL